MERQCFLVCKWFLSLERCLVVSHNHLPLADLRSIVNLIHHILQGTIPNLQNKVKEHCWYHVKAIKESFSLKLSLPLL